MSQPRCCPGHLYRALFTVICCLALSAGTISTWTARAAPASTPPIYVNTTQDELNVDGDCSLREAVRAANTDTQVDACRAGFGSDTIILPAGTYTLTVAGTNEDNALTGDLDITNSLTIIGMGTQDTQIDGNHIDRILDVFAPAVLQLYQLTLINGSAPATGLYGGGAILNRSSGTLDLNQISLRENSSQSVGGAIDNSGSARLTYVTLDANLASSEESLYVAGGAIYNGGSLIVYNSLFFNNTASNPDGIDYGGGLFNDNTATLLNVTFSQNSAEWGGGIFHNGDEANLYNVTFTDNSTAIHTAFSLRIKNSIVSNSTAGVNCNGDGIITSLGHNIDSGTSCNFDIEGINPLLGTLADNLGPIYTHALLPGSPAIDSGDNTDCPATDQRGAIRPADGNGDTLRVCDIGAYEYQAYFPIIIYLPILRK
mgnify:CR=1 FL=1